MPTSLESAIQGYMRANALARETRDEYFSTINKWKAWGGNVSLEELGRREAREFLDWVYERALLERDSKQRGHSHVQSRRTILTTFNTVDVLCIPPLTQLVAASVVIFFCLLADGQTALAKCRIG